MKTLIPLLLFLMSTSGMAANPIYCRHISTPDNSQIVIAYSYYDFNLSTDSSGVYGRELLINKEIYTGKTWCISSDFKRMSRTDNENTIEIHTDNEDILIVKDNAGNLFRHIYYNECSKYPPFNCQTKMLQKLQCTENLDELAKLQYPPKEKLP